MVIQCTQLFTKTQFKFYIKPELDYQYYKRRFIIENGSNFDTYY